MHNLVEFLAKYNHWFLFIVLEVISMVLLFQFNNYQGSVWFTSANAVAGKVYEADAQVKSYFNLSTVNAELTQRNLQLEQQVKFLEESLLDKTADSLTMANRQMQYLSQFGLVPAKVISNSLDKTDNLITIDKGSADGIHKDMGVACGNGVVGVVYLVSEHYSIVIPVLNSQSNISCTIQKRGYFGYLRWKGGSSDIAYVEDIPRHAHFRKHDKVVTSGYSSIFPPGIMVGEIQQVYNSKDGLSYRLKVKLSVDFGKLRDVCVINDKAMEERIELLRAAQDSIKPKQN
ncbi:MAG: rod shape-determining protein MreC [Prevotella sp.]|nr:rod shape-determining protein MreC [Prevotella sp.]MDD7047351.1 rod shape-determining protein MreC [Prevotella sp.]MDY5547571.1 rod shape-determining protein MreC [Prevotella sp.]